MSLRALRVALVALVMAPAVLACGGGDPGAADDDGGLRGPTGGRLTFDAAMLDEVDAFVPLPPDGGPPPRDAGPPPPRDAGRIDAGRRCTGVASSCLVVGSISCTSQRGCYRDGDCRGVSRSCYSIYSSYSCARQDGCYWSSSRDDCSGSARSCSAYSGSASCTGQDGCRWEDDCTGSAYPCNLLTPTECTSQRGCYLE